MTASWNFVFVRDTTQEVVQVSRAKGTDLEPPAPLPGTQVYDYNYTGRLPAFWLNGEAHPVPPAPSNWHVWNWFPVFSWTEDVERAKQAAWRSVKAARDEREFGPFQYNAMYFDGDQDAQRRISLAVLGAQAALTAGTPWTLDWTLANNTVINLTAEEMVSVAEALGANITAAHEEARQKRAAIDAATTIVELEAICPELTATSGTS